MKLFSWPIQIWFWIALGGALGAMTRASWVLLGSEVLFATLASNMVGSLMLGFGVQYAQSQANRWPLLQSFLPAYCAGLTTFSGLTADVYGWFVMGQWIWMGAWLLASATLSVVSLAMGWWWSDRWFNHRHQS